jgi:predicted alpha/beta superfamily hydrolase
MGSPAFMKTAQAQTAAFEDDLIQVVIPMIDSSYRTIPDRDHRAMAGLSMGGMQTYQITTNHLDKFSYIGGFSGAGTGFVSGNNTFDPPIQQPSTRRCIWFGLAWERLNRSGCIRASSPSTKHWSRQGSTSNSTSPQGLRTNGRPGGGTSIYLARCCFRIK